MYLAVGLLLALAFGCVVDGVDVADGGLDVVVAGEVMVVEASRAATLRLFLGGIAQLSGCCCWISARSCCCLVLTVASLQVYFNSQYGP